MPEATQDLLAGSKRPLHIGTGNCFMLIYTSSSSIPGHIKANSVITLGL